MPTTSSVELRYTQEEPLPCPISSVIHPWMGGYLLLRSNPYMAKSDVNGRVEIKNLPIGRHRFRLWHEQVGYVKNIRIGAAEVDSRGRVILRIAEGENDFADTHVGPAVLERKK